MDGCATKKGGGYAERLLQPHPGEGSKMTVWVQRITDCRISRCFDRWSGHPTARALRSIV